MKKQKSGTAPATTISLPGGKSAAIGFPAEEKEDYREKLASFKTQMAELGLKKAKTLSGFVQLVLDERELTADKDTGEITIKVKLH